MLSQALWKGDLKLTWGQVILLHVLWVFFVHLLKQQLVVTVTSSDVHHGSSFSFQSARHSQPFLLLSVFTLLSVCFVLYGKGRIWWQKFFAFRHCCEFGLFCDSFHLSQPKSPGSSQILIVSTCGCVGWRVYISDMRTEWWQALWKW